MLKKSAVNLKINGFVGPMYPVGVEDLQKIRDEKVSGVKFLIDTAERVSGFVILCSECTQEWEISFRFLRKGVIYIIAFPLKKWDEKRKQLVPERRIAVYTSKIVTDIKMEYLVKAFQKAMIGMTKYSA